MPKRPAVRALSFDFGSTACRQREHSFVGIADKIVEIRPPVEVVKWINKGSFSI
jgi:hypothetical protein